MSEITNSKLVADTQATLVEWALGLQDPVAIAQATGYLIEELKNIQSELATHRSVVVRQLRAEGWSLAEIGAALNLSRARIEQIANR